MNKPQHIPKISIGIPLYNEERYLEQALDSLLNQDFPDFEIVISDNNSNDRTQEICIEYASKDSRIRYCRNEENIGALKNFNRVFELSCGEYFMWASGHDLWSPNLLRACLEILEEDEKVVLAYPQLTYIDCEGKEIPWDGRFFFDTRSLYGDIPRFIIFIWGYPSNSMIYGLCRSSALRQTSLMLNSAAEMVPLAELSFIGTFGQVPEPLFHERLQRGIESFEDRLNRYPHEFNPNKFNPKTSNRSLKLISMLPHWQASCQLILIILRFRVNFAKKFLLLWCSVPVCFVRWRKSMLEEVKWFIRQLFYPVQNT